MTLHENRDRLDATFNGDPFAGVLAVEVVEWAGGSARVRAMPKAEHCNFLGGVHGAFLYAGADVALSIASNSWGRIAVAVSIDMHYLAAAQLDEALEFSAAETSRGRSIATYALEVRCQGELIANATGVTFRTARWHFGDEVWSDDWRSRN